MSKRDLTLAIALLLGVLATAFLFLRGDSTLDEWRDRWNGADERPDIALTYLGEGSFELVALDDGEVLDTWQADKLSMPPALDETVGEAKPKKTETKKVDTKKDEGTANGITADGRTYEIVEMLVFPGDNAWKIQEGLTPEADILSLMPEVKKVNGGREMHPIFPGKTYKFLKEKEVDAPETEPPEKPEEESEEPPETPEPAEEPAQVTEYVVSRSLVDDTFVVVTEGQVHVLSPEKDAIHRETIAVDTAGVTGVRRLVTGVLLDGIFGTRYVTEEGSVADVPSGAAATSDAFTAFVEDNNVLVTDARGTSEILISRPVHQLIVFGDELYGLIEGPDGEKVFTVFDVANGRVSNFLEVDEPIERLMVAGGDLHAISKKTFYRMDVVKGQLRVEGTFDGELVQPDRTHPVDYAEGVLNIRDMDFEKSGTGAVLFRTS